MLSQMRKRFQQLHNHQITWLCLKCWRSIYNCFLLLLLKDDQLGMDLSLFLTTSTPIATKTASKIHVTNDHAKVQTAYNIPMLFILICQISALLDSTIIVNAGNIRKIPIMIKNHPNHSGKECRLVTNYRPPFQLVLYF